jgi:CIC family chloride channel protein
MFGSILIGLLAAAIASLPLMVTKWVPNLDLQSPLLIVGVALIAIVLQQFLHRRKDGANSYCGFSDMLIHIHSPATPDSPMRWMVHGVISLLFSLFGGVVGAEGPAAEFTHAAAMSIQARSARWFEQRRRSDAAMAISAALAATFHAPFAGILLPLELGIGGRTLGSLVSALVAYLSVEFLSKHFGFEHFDATGALEGFHFSGWMSWALPAILGLVMGAASILFIKLTRYSEDVFHSWPRWLRPLVAGAVIAFVAYFYKPAHAPSWMLLEDVFWSKHSLMESGLILIALSLSVIMVVSGFGTLGILTPLFAIGGIMGFGFNQWIWSAMPGFSVVSGFAGVAALWGGVVGAPLTASVLIFEMTGNQHILIPCLIAGVISREFCRLFGVQPIFQAELSGRGMKLIEGRSAEVLQTLFVKHAMVTDLELADEHEQVIDVYQRLLKSPYAFLPVVNAKGKYLGLLTADVIMEAWQETSRAIDQGSITSTEQVVSSLVVAKDLLYRSGFKVPSIRAEDTLAASAGIFHDFPCVPAVDEQGQVVGLLFVYSVRLAYDREMAKRSLWAGTVK